MRSRVARVLLKCLGVRLFMVLAAVSMSGCAHGSFLVDVILFFTPHPTSRPEETVTLSPRSRALLERSRDELARQSRCSVVATPVDERSWELRSCDERVVCEPESNTYRCEPG